MDWEILFENSKNLLQVFLARLQWLLDTKYKNFPIRKKTWSYVCFFLTLILSQVLLNTESNICANNLKMWIFLDTFYTWTHLISYPELKNTFLPRLVWEKINILMHWSKKL